MSEPLAPGPAPLDRSTEDDGLRGIWTTLRLVNLRHLRERPRRTLLTVVGLSASVCLLITISVINSTLTGSIEAETRGLAGDAALEVAPATTGGLSRSVTSSVGSAPGVRAAVPFLKEFSRIRSGRTNARVVIFGVPPNLVDLFPEGLEDTTRQLEEPGFRAGGLIVTRQLAQSLGARAGATVLVETPDGYQRLRVSAVLVHAPFAAVNGGQFALMALLRAQATFVRGSHVDGVYVASRHRWSKAMLRSALRLRLDAGALIEDPGDGAQAYKRTFDSIASISQESRTVGLVVAFFLVLNTMHMSLAERRREIALLVAGGSSRLQITGALLAEATLLGLFGSALGIAGGAVLAHALLQHAVDSYNILPVSSAGPLVVRPIDVLLGLVGGLTVTIVGAGLPAMRILRTAPIDALRPDAAFEWTAQRRPTFPRSILLLGVGMIGVSALLALLAPLGSSVMLAGLALACVLTGAALTFPWLVPTLASGVGRLLSRPVAPVGKLAAGSLLRNPGRTTVAAGGLAIAAAFVLGVGTSVGSYRQETVQAAGAWYAAPLYVNAQGSAAYISDQPLPVSLAQRLVDVPGVAAVYPMRFGLIDNRGHQLVIYALPVAQAARAGHQITGSLGISQHQLVNALGRGEIAISRLTARRHHVSVGDTLNLPTSSGARRIRIGALFNDIASFDSVFLERSFYERLSGDDTADRFAVVTKLGANTSEVRRSLERFLETNRVPASILTRDQMSGYLVNSIQSLFSIAVAIQAAALLVAGLIVLSTMLTATFERRREFAVERLLGIGRGWLCGSVVLEAVAISLVGAIVAVGLGLGLGFLMTFSIENELAWRISFSPSPALTAGTVLAVILLGALAALYPSWLATRQKIISLLDEP